MSGYGAGIQRGRMAGDNFTQIANALFRDPRMGFKAKGIFGLISTHTDGWRVTVADLVRAGTDGKSSVTSGLKELEKFGYLDRDRERNADGTLGDAVYSITDMPAHLFELFGEDAPDLPRKPRNRRSEPKSENPALDNPAQANRTTKKTNPKKTNNQNTNSVRPSVPAGGGVREAAPVARTDGRGGGVDRVQEEKQLPAGGDPDGGGVTGDATLAAGGPEAKAAARAGGAPAAGPVRVDASPGVDLLMAIGVERPELLLTGRTLRDQGLMVSGLLAAGWSEAQLRQVVAGRPLPEPLTRSVGAVISARLRAAASMPVPKAAAGGGLVPAQGGHDAAARSPRSAVPPAADCAGCGARAVPGRDRCAVCLDWPRCTGGCDVRVEHGELCPTCAVTAEHAAVAATPADDGTCPGHGGQPCGRQVQSLGMCGRCRIAVERARATADAEWERTVAAAVTAAAAAEATDAMPHHTTV